jgi:Phosphotransferase enzyme family
MASAMADFPTHDRCLLPGELGERFVSYYRRWSNLGLAPEIVAVTPEKLTTRLCLPLKDWLQSERSASERLEMGGRLYRRLEELHKHGMCHRDMHAGNVVLLEGIPLLIDPALATESDPLRPCYDLYGPELSGVAVPADHYGYLPNRGGVWWDCGAEVPALKDAIGSLSAVIASLA